MEHLLDETACYPRFEAALLRQTSTLVPALIRLAQQSARGALKQYDKHIAPQLALLRRSRLFDIANAPPLKSYYTSADLNLPSD